MKKIVALSLSLIGIVAVCLAVGTAFAEREEGEGEGEGEDEKLPTSQVRDDGTFENGATGLVPVESDPHITGGLPKGVDGVPVRKVGAERYRCEFNTSTGQYEAVLAPKDYEERHMRVTDNPEECQISPQVGQGGASYVIDRAPPPKP